MNSEKSGSPKVLPLQRKRCPRCKKPTVDGYRPFCSKRCADLDLGAWLNGSYRIPTEQEAGIDDEDTDDARPTGQPPPYLL